MSKNSELIGKNENLAQIIAEEGIVLLENKEYLLPLAPEESLAVFGRGQLDTKIGGSGSGATDTDNTVNIISGLKQFDFNLVTEILDFYQDKISEVKADEQDDISFESIVSQEKDKNEDDNLPWWYEFWGKYDPPPPEFMIDDYLVKRAAQKADTAVIVISKVSGGEECDRRLKNDYYLSDSEKKLIEQINREFNQIIIILNTCGIIDLSWVKDYSSIKGVLNISLPGQTAGKAVAKVLCGQVTPSGKLVDTYAQSYQDYPSSEHFSFNKDKKESIKTYQDYGLDAEENGSRDFTISPVTVYQEGIFGGYRYFDTFGVDPVYPFGYGLSYTDFSIDFLEGSINIDEQLINLKINVKNIGNKYSGKEVVQIYLSKPDGILEKPYQELVAFCKTINLKSGEKQKLNLNFSLSELASYSQKTASYIVEQGYYYIRVGNSSRNTNINAKIFVPETMTLKKLSNQLEIQAVNQGKINFLKKAKVNPISYKGEEKEKESAELINELTSKMIETIEKEGTAENYFDSLNDIGEEVKTSKDYKLEDVKNNDINMEEFIASLSVKELSVLCNGYSNGKAFGGNPEDPKTIKNDNGNPIGSDSTDLKDDLVSRSPAIKKRGIPSITYKDGPAGIGHTAWPVETMMASTWNKELLYAFGDAVGSQCEAEGINVWLAPAVNLHRNPLAGRNFEYYSEDPLLTGKCAVAVTNGAMDNHNITVSAKHFVLNEQETYRRGQAANNIDAVDSIVEERVIREIYLKPFEMLVQNTEIKNIMTAFNKINGTFAAGNRDLNINILRGEWGFKGYLVTDWGDMDIVVDGANAVAAGNDVVMPGGPPVINQMLAGYKEGRVSLKQFRKSVYNFLETLLYLEN